MSICTISEKRDVALVSLASIDIYPYKCFGNTWKQNAPLHNDYSITSKSSECGGIELLHIHGNASDAMLLYQTETEYASSSTKN